MTTEIDSQLPYIQVHRSVAAMAARVASTLGVTNQHARGSFDDFWEALADRRILAKAAALPEPMIALDDKECRLRLRIAFAKEVDPELLVPVGALEPLADGCWRVRGMSRYIEAEQARLKKRQGKHPGSTPPAPQSHPGPTGVPPGSDPPATPPAPGSHPTDERDETKETRRKTENEEEVPPPLPKPPGDRFASGEAFWAHTQHQRHSLGYVTEKAPKRSLSTWWNEVMLELNGKPQPLDEALRRFGANKYWADSKPPWPFDAFMKNWRDYVRLRAG